MLHNLFVYVAAYGIEILVYNIFPVYIMRSGNNKQVEEVQQELVLCQRCSRCG